MCDNCGAAESSVYGTFHKQLCTSLTPCSSLSHIRDGPFSAITHTSTYANCVALLKSLGLQT